MKKFDTVIFDLDGSLLSTLEDIADGVNYILKKYGYPQRTYDEIRSFVGNGSARLLGRALPNGQNNPNFEKYLDEYKRYYLEHNNIKTSPYEGIMGLLKGLYERKYKLAKRTVPKEINVLELFVN